MGKFSPFLDMNHPKCQFIVDMNFFFHLKKKISSPNLDFIAFPTFNQSSDLSPCAHTSMFTTHTLTQIHLTQHKYIHTYTSV